MGKFYVYGLLDPRKKGQFPYKDCPVSFLFEPFYIGKGQTTRAYAHFSERIERTANPFKVNKINRIKERGKTPILIKIAENLENKEALDTEALFIKSIGRGKQGPLTNLTDGGEGIVGYKHTEKSKELIIASNKRRVFSKDTKKRISIGVKLSGFKHTPEMKENQRRRVSGNKNFFYGKRFCGSNSPMFGRHLSKEQKALLSKWAQNRKGLKNPNIKYSYCIYNSKTKEQFHNIFDLSIIGKKINPSLKSVNFRRFKEWVLVRTKKEGIKICACKDILSCKINEVPMGKGRLKLYMLNVT